jgi:DNA-directed RNA polymerase subunit RPC12/RpoP
MPWKCPACATEVRHSAAEPMPRVGAIYRCPACRIELVVDTRTSKMKVAPVAAAADGGETRGPGRRTRKK